MFGGLRKRWGRRAFWWGILNFGGFMNEMFFLNNI
jgi:hypothetical protein